MSKGLCYACNSKTYKKLGPSERHFMWDYIKLAPAGVCHVCQRGFCKQHFGYVHEFDPELSTFGQAVYCIECLDRLEDEVEKNYRARRKRAKSWENWLGPIGHMVACCIRSRKPVYFGSRSKKSNK